MNFVFLECKTCSAAATLTNPCLPGSNQDSALCICNAGYYGDGVSCRLIMNLLLAILNANWTKWNMHNILFHLKVAYFSYSTVHDSFVWIAAHARSVTCMPHYQIPVHQDLPLIHQVVPAKQDTLGMEQYALVCISRN